MIKLFMHYTHLSFAWYHGRPWPSVWAGQVRIPGWTLVFAGSDYLSIFARAFSATEVMDKTMSDFYPDCEPSNSTSPPRENAHPKGCHERSIF